MLQRVCGRVTRGSLHAQASDASGTFSVIKATDNSGKSLPGGYSNKKLSAAQLANAQQIIKQANDMAATTNYTGPIVTGSGDDYTQVCAMITHRLHAIVFDAELMGDVPHPWHQGTSGVCTKGRLVTSAGIYV